MNGSPGGVKKIDPKTGKVTEFTIPTLRSQVPTGELALRPDEDGNLWIAMMYQGAVGKFDRKTEKFQTWVIPSGGGVVRNMVSTPDGNLWLACSGVNGIAFVEVKNSTKMSSLP